MKTLQRPVSKFGSVSWRLSLYHWNPSQDERSGMPCGWWSADPELSEKFVTLSPFPSDELFPVPTGETVSAEQLKEICCSVSIGWPKSKNCGVLTSSGFFEVCVEWDMVSRQETFSLMLGFWNIGLFGALVGAVAAWSSGGKPAGNRPDCSLLRWRSDKDRP